MKKWSDFLKIALTFTLSSGMFIHSAFAAPDDFNGNSEQYATPASAVKNALTRLGHNYTESKDIQGNPHFVITDDNDENVQNIAVFMTDCGKAGCDDVLLYADFGVLKHITPEHLNNWNHISAMHRTRLFLSGDVNSARHVGQSSVVSFLGHSKADQEKLAMQIGLFLVEVGIFSSAVEQSGLK